MSYHRHTAGLSLRRAITNMTSCSISIRGTYVYTVLQDDLDGQKHEGTRNRSLKRSGRVKSSAVCDPEALLHLHITKPMKSGDKVRGTTARTQGLYEETPRLTHSSTSLALTNSTSKRGSELTSGGVNLPLWQPEHTRGRQQGQLCDSQGATSGYRNTRHLEDSCFK